MLSAVLGGLTGGTIGFVASLVAEGLQRRIYGPFLELDYGSGDHYLAHADLLDKTTEQKVGNSIYIRMRVRNTKLRVAKSCRAYLTKVEKRKPDLSFEEDAMFGDSMQLAWAAQGSAEAMFRPLDIPSGINQFVDIVFVGDVLPPRLCPALAFQLSTHKRLWDFQGTYRLTVLVSGDGVKPVSRRLFVTWNGIWDQVAASDAGPGDV